MKLRPIAPSTPAWKRSARRPAIGAMVASATGQAVRRMPVSVALRPSTVWKKNGRQTKARPCAANVQVEAASESEKIGRLKMSIGIMGCTRRF